MIAFVQILMLTTLMMGCWSQTSLNRTQEGRTGVDLEIKEETKEGDETEMLQKAGQETDFKSQIQLSAMPVNSNIWERQRHLQEIMKIIPKFQLRTGFPQLDIKIIPPSDVIAATETTTKTYETQTKVKKFEEATQTVSTPKINSLDSVTEKMLEKTTMTNGFKEGSQIKKADVDDERKIKEEIIIDIKEVISTTPRISSEMDKCTKLCESQHGAAEEGRAHLKSNEDRVQVEMEQIIRAEMQDPTGVNLGVPYQSYENKAVTGNKQYILKPFNIDYKPLRSGEDIMKEGYEQKDANKNVPVQYLFDGNIHQFPYPGDSAWLRLAGARYPEESRAMLTPPIQLTQAARPARYQPLYATGLAFIVLPRQ